MQAEFPGNCEKEEPRGKDRVNAPNMREKIRDGNVRFVNVNVVLCYRKRACLNGHCAGAAKKKKKRIGSGSGRSNERSGLT
jgi:hypothetical protein